MRVGIDLVSVAAVRESVQEHGDRYLERVYTPEELAHCRTERGVDCERLAGRFAVKEAAIKVLRPADEPVPWLAIGVRRDEAGALELELRDGAAELAARAGIASLAVSLTHEGPFACAVVVAELSA